MAHARRARRHLANARDERTLVEDGRAHRDAIMGMDFTIGPRQVRRKTVDLDWSDEPLRCASRVALPADDPHSVESVNRRASERVLRAIESDLAEGWEPDGELWSAITLETRRRQVLLPTPGMAGPEWEEYYAAHVRLRQR